jgi:hypothetical protein
LQTIRYLWYARIYAQWWPMQTGVLTFAGVLAVAFCTAFVHPKAVQMGKEGRHFAQYVWYTIGLSAVGLVLLGWAQSGDQFLAAQRILLFVVGAMIGGCALVAAGEWLRPSQALAQTPAGAPMTTGPTINTWNQSGGINTINVGPTRLPFDPSIAADLVSRLPAGKPLTVITVGSNTDQVIGAEYVKFLKDKGFAVTWNSAGMYAPPPDHKITIQNLDAPQVMVIIAPSAN